MRTRRFDIPGLTLAMLLACAVAPAGANAVEVLADAPTVEVAATVPVPASIPVEDVAAIGADPEQDSEALTVRVGAAASSAAPGSQVVEAAQAVTRSVGVDDPAPRLAPATASPARDMRHPLPVFGRVVAPPERELCLTCLQAEGAPASAHARTRTLATSSEAATLSHVLGATEGAIRHDVATIRVASLRGLADHVARDGSGGDEAPGRWRHDPGSDQFDEDAVPVRHGPLHALGEPTEDAGMRAAGPAPPPG